MTGWQGLPPMQVGNGKSWLDKPMNQGAANVTSAHGGGGLKMVGVLNGSGRGMFGGGGDKLSNLLGTIFDDFKKMSYPVQQCSPNEVYGHGLGTSTGRGDIGIE